MLISTIISFKNWEVVGEGVEIGVREVVAIENVVGGVGEAVAVLVAVAGGAVSGGTDAGVVVIGGAI